MKRKMIALLLALALILLLAACGEGEETTLTGMVVSVDGTTLSLMEMDGATGGNFAQGERPEMPEGMENFGDFDPEAFAGALPEGETFPPREAGEMPEMPEGMTPPEGMTMPEDGGMRPNFDNSEIDAEATAVDVANAHISIEIDSGKASGSMEDIQPGTFVTITMNAKGEATYVLITSQSGFGSRMPAWGNN